MRYIIKFSTTKDLEAFTSRIKNAHDRVNESQEHLNKFSLIHEMNMIPVAIIDVKEDKKQEQVMQEINEQFQNVENIEKDVQFKLDVSSITQYMNLDILNKAIQGPFLGDGVVIGLIDGGVLSTHPDLEGVIVDARRFIVNNSVHVQEETEMPGKDGLDSNKGELAEEEHFNKDHEQGDLLAIGHGTAMAGVICGSGKSSGGKHAGIAPNAVLLDAKAFDDSFKGWLTDILQAIEWCVENKAEILCMGFSSIDNSKKHEIFEYYIEYLTSKKDVIVCTSVGNDPSIWPRLPQPGSFESVITCGTLDYLKKSIPISKNSLNYKRDPDVYIPLEEFLSLNILNSAYKVECNDPNEYYAFFSGSSMAAGILTGLMAVIKSIKKGENGASYKRLLISTAIEHDFYHESGKKITIKVPDLVEIANIHDKFDVIKMHISSVVGSAAFAGFFSLLIPILIVFIIIKML
ncbi:MAG: S8 family peptidase [Promethearchaeota archaeon]